jgi:hypothetical protein
MSIQGGNEIDDEGNNDGDGGDMIKIISMMMIMQSNITLKNNVIYLSFCIFPSACLNIFSLQYLF